MSTKVSENKKRGKKSRRGKKAMRPIRRYRRMNADKKLTINGWIVAGILFVLAVVCSVPHLSDHSPKEKGAPVPRGFYRYGIDISNYQKEVMWDSLKVLVDSKGRTAKSVTRADRAYEVSFVFIKATEGISGKDKMFSSHWANAEKAGIQRGAYHFFRSSRNPEKQAENFISTVGPISAYDLPPVLDVETLHKGGLKADLNNGIRIWLRIVEDHYGIKPMIYSSEKFIKDMLDPDIVADYPIWCANYNYLKPTACKWLIWQFTDLAVVYGIDGYVDLNAIELE